MWSPSAEGFPAAVLIRAIQPVDGVRGIARRRSHRDTHGPGKLTQGLGITGTGKRPRFDKPQIEAVDRGRPARSEFARDARPARGFEYCAGTVEIQALAVPGQRLEPGDRRSRDDTKSGSYLGGIMGLLDGKTALIFGLANERSIAWGITQAMHREGARIGISYAGEALERRVRPLAEQIHCQWVEECDVTKDDHIAAIAEKARKDFRADRRAGALDRVRRP